MTTIPLEEGVLSIPEDATDDQAAALAAAIAAYLGDRERVAAAAAAAGGEEGGWQGRRWQFAGRTEALSGCARRVPTSAPRDGWTAHGRLEGLDRP